MRNDSQWVHFIIFGKKTYLNDNVVWTSVVSVLDFESNFRVWFFILFLFHKTFEFEGNFLNQYQKLGFQRLHKNLEANLG